jgi:hypothetical protein
MGEVDPTIAGRLRPGEERTFGGMVDIDVMGPQARAEAGPERDRVAPVIEHLPRPANASGSVSLAGTSPPVDPGAHDPHAGGGWHERPPRLRWSRTITATMGGAMLERPNVELRRPARARHPEPDRIVSQRLTLASAPVTLEGLGRRSPRCPRVPFRPTLEVAR